MQTAVNTTTPTRTIVEEITSLKNEFVELERFEAGMQADVDKNRNGLLSKSYDIYVRVSDGRDTTALYEFTAYYEKTGFKNTSKVSLITKVLNCTFDGLNVSKRSAYKAVIQFAIDKGVVKGGLLEFINSYGGLQNARLAKYAAARAKSTAPDYGTRLQQTQSYFAQKQLASVPEETMTAALANVKVDSPFVLIATRTADGQVVFNVASADSKAVNAVYNIMYKGSKQNIANAAKTSSQTSFPPTGTAPVPPGSFAASSYSTDALSTKNVVKQILEQVSEQAVEDACA